MTAKSNGLEELAQEIRVDAGLEEADVEDVEVTQSTLKPPPIVTETANLNWPTVAQGETVDDAELEAELQALVNEAEVEKVHTQQRLTEDKLRAPTHTPDAEEPPTQSTSSLDKMAVPA